MKKEVKGYPLILGYLGIFMVFEGIITAVPLLMMLIFPNEVSAFWHFALPSGGGILLGLALYFIFIAGREKGHMDPHENSFLLVFTWINAIILGAMPLFLSSIDMSGLPQLGEYVLASDSGMNFAKSFFESTSAYSTTGLTVYTNFMDSAASGSEALYYATHATHVFQFHRAFMQFVGGIGLVLILSNLLGGRNAMSLYLSEGHNDALVPQLAKSARRIFLIYTSWVLAGAVAFWLFGMNPFEAVCNAMCNVATGGFSPRTNSFYSYQLLEGQLMSGCFLPVNSLGLEAVAVVLMLVGVTNFVLHTFLLKFRFRDFFRDCEIIYAIVVIVLFTLVGAWQISWNPDSYLNQTPELLAHSLKGIPFHQALRYSFFTVVSSMSTCGSSNMFSLRLMGYGLTFVSIYLMATGGGMGSTSGAIKQYRICVIIRNIYWNVRYHFASPKTLNPKTIYRLGEKKELDEQTDREAFYFTVIFVTIILVGTLACTCLPGISILESAYVFTTALAGTGLSIVDFGALEAAHQTSYYWFIWILVIAMFIGRLEIMPAYYSIRKLAIDPVKSISKAIQDHKAAKGA